MRDARDARVGTTLFAGVISAFLAVAGLEVLGSAMAACAVVLAVASGVLQARLWRLRIRRLAAMG